MSTKTYIPEHYAPLLNLYDTQKAIGLLKRVFEDTLCGNLRLRRVSAPLFVEAASGLNDDLNGVERPVSFDIPAAGRDAQVVHSLAKWKRMALYRYDFHTGKGIYADMNAIRRDEELDNLHSIYVDQWDWEKVITKEQRTEEYLEETVVTIYHALKNLGDYVNRLYRDIQIELPNEITFIDSQDLEDRYPDKTPKEREDLITKEYGAVFIKRIGGVLASGEKHDGRAPDYDDWELNGDILVWNDVLDRAFEISSMGIRVDEKALKEQLEKAGCPERENLPFQKEILEKKLPYTIGGGIGQSRICMFFLKKAHIGEVQASIWPDDVWEEASKKGLNIL